MVVVASTVCLEHIRNRPSLIVCSVHERYIASIDRRGYGVERLGRRIVCIVGKGLMSEGVSGDGEIRTSDRANTRSVMGHLRVL